MTDWQSRAACRPYPLAMFHPETERGADPAIAVCLTCPVATECLNDALTNGGAGVRGGYTAQGRKRLMRTRARREAAPVVKARARQCGTNAGYVRHRRAGEQSCFECLQAHTDYNRTREAS